MSTKRRYAQSFRGVKSRTEQHHKNDCDIHVIVARYKRTGELPLIMRTGDYGDARLPDLHTASLTVANAATLFEELPSRVRDYMRNDPLNLEPYLRDKASREHLLRLGFTEQALAAFGNPPASPPTGEPSSTPEAGGDVTPSPTNSGAARTA